VLAMYSQLDDILVKSEGEGMHPTLIEVFGFSIPEHGVVSAIAILLGLGVTSYFAKLKGINDDDVMSLAVSVILGGLIGARLWEVLFFQPGYYFQHPMEMLAVWNGGMSVQGGLIGGMLTAIWRVRRLKWSFWETGDLFAPGLILGQAIGRVACFLNGDAYGSPTGSSFGLVYPPGTPAYAEYGSQPLWPAEVFESQWNMVVFALLILLKKRDLPAGLLFVAYMALYFGGRFALELLRGDSPRYLFNFTAGQWTSVVAVLVTVVLYLITAMRRRNATV
ncbi:MAG: prolipoprotein diacylglyceryl transferase, partial [Tumebacillaceae bacterium]